MKIWIDLSNAPHARFFNALIKELEQEHELLITARRIGYLEDLIKKLGINTRIVGAHAGLENIDKLEASTTRILELTKLVKEFKPDKFLCKYSVEGMRIAHGLALERILVVDNDQSVSQNNLTIPLASAIILPAVMEAKMREQYGNRNFVSFNGVCELAHIKDFTPDKTILDELGLNEKDNILTMRSGPLEAHYFKGDESKLSDFIAGMDMKIVAFPRNDFDATQLEKHGIIAMKQGMDSLSLTYCSKAFLGEGGTMTREAALLGTPTVSCYPHELLAVDRFLIEKGLMQHSTDMNEIKQAILKADKGKSRTLAEKTLQTLEDPIQKVREALGV